MLTSWFTPRLLLVMQSLSKKASTSKQRCVPAEDCKSQAKHWPVVKHGQIILYQNQVGSYILLLSPVLL